MERILAMVEGLSISEITNFDQIYQSILKEFLEKSTVWDFYRMTRKQYINKDEGERESFILKYYNAMVQVNFCYLLSAVSDVSLKFSDVLFVVVLLANDESELKLSFAYKLIPFSANDLGFKDKFCSVSFVSLIINLSFISSSDKICSVSEVLLANDSLSEFEFESESESKSLDVKLPFEYNLTHF